jgi:hypothetical protein
MRHMYLQGLVNVMATMIAAFSSPRDKPLSRL